MAGIITGTYGCDVHSGATHVLKRVFRELRGNPAPLKVGIYTDDLDHSHSLVEGVESDCHEPDGPFLHDRDEGVSLTTPTTVPHLLSLRDPPIRLQAKEDRVPENLAQGSENRFLCAKREFHDRVEVALLKLADLDSSLVGHDETLALSAGPARSQDLQAMHPAIGHAADEAAHQPSVSSPKRG